MASILSQVTDKVYLAPPKGIIYGSAGVGKSTFAANSDAETLMIDCENGLGAIKCKKTPHYTRWTDVQAVLIAIAREEHEYKAIVIDSLDWLLRRIEETVIGCVDGKGMTNSLSASHGGYGKGKGVLENYVYQSLLPLLDEITNRGITVTLIAHARRSEITDSNGVSVEKTTPDISPTFLNVFVEWSDYVCLIQKSEAGERTILTEETPRALAKNRYGLEKIVPCDFKAFQTAIIEGTNHRFE